MSYTGFTGRSVVGRVSATDGDRTSPNNVVSYSLTPTTDFNTPGDGTIFNTVICGLQTFVYLTDFTPFLFKEGHISSVCLSALL